MTERLRQELRRTADTAPAYPVYERAVATARRSRRRAAGAWAVIIAVVAVAVPFASRPQPIPAAAGEPPSVPDRIGLPAYGSHDAGDRPHLDAAAVSFIGNSRRLGLLSGESDLGGLVGAHDERYRTIDVGIASERAPLLSPDGRLAATGGALVDLSSGRSSPLALTPLAWSPDGRQIAGTTLGAAPDAVDLVLMEVTGGQVRTLATSVEDGAPRFTVAFSPSGDRLAYVADRRVHVQDRTGRELSAFTPPAGYHLAGKGAWAPGELSLALTSPQTGTWEPRWFDPGTGGPVVGPDLPAVPGSVVVADLLGWRPDGAALLHVRREPGSAPPGPAGEPANQLLSLAPGAAQPVRITGIDDAITHLDVADQAIGGGRTRVGDPPFPIGPDVLWWSAGTLVAIAALAALLRWRRRATAVARLR